jgi:hypothetical protein
MRPDKMLGFSENQMQKDGHNDSGSLNGSFFSLILLSLPPRNGTF